MRNIAEMIKRQTDSILRQTKQGPTGGGGVIVETSDGESSIYNPGMGGRDLATHKSSGDHDGRYSLITDLNTHKTSDDHDGRYYTESEADLRFAPLGNTAISFHQTFEVLDTIVVQHNLGKRPIVQVVGQVAIPYGDGLYGVGPYGGIDNTNNTVITPTSITHNTLNQVTITLAAAMNGEVICVG